MPDSLGVDAAEQLVHTPPSNEPVAFPLSWLLKNASPPIQYRAITEVAKLSENGAGYSAIPLAFGPSLTLALAQRTDGTWNNTMLTVPSGEPPSVAGVGTISAVRRLLESGWDRDTPPIHQARRVLFRLLAEDDDPNFLFELRAKGRMELEMVRRGRSILREAAAASLARAGYEQDPRLRGAARRVINRVEGFVRSPLAQKPWIRSGNRQVLAPEATPPSIYALEMLAFMPTFRSENSTQIDHLYNFLSQALPRQESAQIVGSTIVDQPHLVLGDWLPHRNAADADVPMALYWLELMARLHFLRRNENWSRLLDRFLDDRDRDAVWHPHKGTVAPKSPNPLAWHAFPLEPTATQEDRWTDVTFRLGLIARLSGRPIELL
ncbi:MAG: hypothetical protein ABI877_01555 [Gemmatimonadaceae bacterium]